MSNYEDLKDEISILKKELKNHKLIYSRLDELYYKINNEAKLNKNNKKLQYRKEWIDNNWKSIMNTFADQIIDMIDNSWNSNELNEK